uniref:Progestin and adipoQ receptor family member IIIa n=1 Tax=Xiphophorus maculatus TaxID=8083 RepID=A0A3B5QMS4_XIPMA
MRSSYFKPQNGSNYKYTKLKASSQFKTDSPSKSVAMSQKPQKNAQTAHYIELGGYQYWPVLVPRGIRLYTYEQIPVFLRENPYITDGYRAYLPSRLCIKSLFILSNETVNIWSHLLGFLLFFCIGVYNMASVLPSIHASKEDYVIYSIGLFCFQLCMLCSVGYHLFCCHRSEKTSRRWMALDYAGVSIGILGCYVPGVFYTFYCNNYWRQVYLVTVLAMILAVFFAQIHPLYLSKQWKQLRSLIFCSVAGYGLIPTLHWIWITGGFSSQLVQVQQTLLVFIHSFCLDVVIVDLFVFLFRLLFHGSLGCTSSQRWRLFFMFLRFQSDISQVSPLSSFTSPLGMHRTLHRVPSIWEISHCLILTCEADLPTSVLFCSPVRGLIDKLTHQIVSACLHLTIVTELLPTQWLSCYI